MGTVGVGRACRFATKLEWTTLYVLADDEDGIGMLNLPCPSNEPNGTVLYFEIC